MSLKSNFERLKDTYSQFNIECMYNDKLEELSDSFDSKIDYDYSDLDEEDSKIDYLSNNNISNNDLAKKYVLEELIKWYELEFDYSLDDDEKEELEFMITEEYLFLND